MTNAPTSAKKSNLTNYGYGLAILVILIDQGTKWLAENTLTFHQPQTVIDPILNWTLAYNTGAAFSFLAQAGGWQKWLFTALAIMIAIFISFHLRTLPKTAKLLATALALIMGGAIGNVIDRLMYGHVIDFIHIHYHDVWHYPIFNVADIAICVGTALMIFDAIFLEPKRTQAQSTSEQSDLPSDPQSNPDPESQQKSDSNQTHNNQDQT